MGYITTHAVQSFVRTKKGRIGRLETRPCSTAEGATRLAQRLVEQGSVLGAQAFTQETNTVTGECEELRFIGTFGMVCDPEDEIPF